MKNIFFQRMKRNAEPGVTETLRMIEWVRQLQDLERYLALCNRRNTVSKTRLL